MLSSRANDSAVTRNCAVTVLSSPGSGGASDAAAEPMCRTADPRDLAWFT
jgi:hypothetical protein